MNDRKRAGSVDNAKRELASLNGQADDVRTHLAALRDELIAAQAGVSGQLGLQLLEANGKLVLAALSAETIAEMAVNNLRELRHQSQHDALTHTANRELMFERLSRAIVSANHHGVHVAVLFFDIDHFRRFNNLLGHSGGDAVLKLIADRLSSTLTAGAVSRHGGDEFLMLLADVTDKSDVESFAQRVLAAVAEPSVIGNMTLHITTSLGIAMYPDDGKDIDTLIEKADQAMYCSKRTAVGKFKFYDDIGSDELGRPFETREAAFGDARPAAGAHLQSSRANRLIDLQDANEKLVVAALNSQELEALAKDAHVQQIKFMAVVSHELRSPLAPIRLAASLLTDRNTTSEQSLTRLRAIIEHQVSHMARLIDDLLDGSRLKTGKLRLHLSDVSVSSILKMAIETCRPTIAARRQCMTIELPAISLYLQGDDVRLTQIFSNLLDNASKYTPDGGSISLVFAELDDTVEITISDTGIGISENVLPHIFDLFVQDTRGLAHSNGGLGIGLAVVKELVEAHGGAVRGDSKGLNFGSEFVVTLPKNSIDSAK